MYAIRSYYVLYMPTTLPGVSVTEAKKILSVTNRLIKSVPEVDQVFGKAVITSYSIHYTKLYEVLKNKISASSSVAFPKRNETRSSGL